jgi:hypothetical protein
MRNKKLLAPLAALLAISLFAACSLEGDEPIPGLSSGGGSGTAVNSVYLNKNYTNINVGTQESLTATVYPTNAKNKNVTWRSSASSVATVSASGTVTGMSAGSANITVTTADGGYTASCYVTVTGGTVNPSYGISLYSGGSLTSHTFPGASQGYGAQTPLTVTVQNTGNQATGSLYISRSGSDSNSFSISTSSLTSISVNGSATFTVAPYTGLSYGTYAATITVSGSNGISAQFYVSFTVTNIGGPITAANLSSYLASLPQNSASSPHNITVRVSSAGEFNTIRAALNNAPNKYVYLDLSGSTVTSIPESAFNDGESSSDGCNSLIGIRISNSVTSIGIYAFFGCIRLASVSIPSSVNDIGGGAFAECRSLTNIIIDSNNSTYLAENGIIFSKNRLYLIAYPTAEGTYTIPSNVVYIWDMAFYACTRLTRVNIPSSVTYIGVLSFTYCVSLASITIPSSVNGIDAYAFLECESLSSVTFQGSIASNRFSTAPNTFPGDLRDKFYASNSSNGTPGTYYTYNPGWGAVWTRQY